MNDYHNQLKALYTAVEKGLIDVETAKVLISILDRLMSLEQNLENTNY